MDTSHAKPTASPDPQLAELIYELLDAHDDTARLAQDRLDDPVWAAHLDYLRCLQRIARGLLARTNAPGAILPPRPAPGSDTGNSVVSP